MLKVSVSQVLPSSRTPMRSACLSKVAHPQVFSRSVSRLPRRTFPCPLQMPQAPRRAMQAQATGADGSGANAKQGLLNAVHGLTYGASLTLDPATKASIDGFIETVKQHPPATGGTLGLAALCQASQLAYSSGPHPLYENLAKLGFGQMPMLEGIRAHEVQQSFLADGGYANVFVALLPEHNNAQIYFVTRGEWRGDPGATTLPVDLHAVELICGPTALDRQGWQRLMPPGTGDRHRVEFDAPKASAADNPYLDRDLRITVGRNHLNFVFVPSPKTFDFV